MVNPQVEPKAFLHCIRMPMAFLHWLILSILVSLLSRVTPKNLADDSISIFQYRLDSSFNLHRLRFLPCGVRCNCKSLTAIKCIIRPTCGSFRYRLFYRRGGSSNGVVGCCNTPTFSVSKLKKFSLYYLAVMDVKKKISQNFSVLYVKNDFRTMRFSNKSRRGAQLLDPARGWCLLYPSFAPVANVSRARFTRPSTPPIS